MKRSSAIVVFLVIAIAVSVFAAACGGQTETTGDPKAVVESMLKAMKASDAEASYNLLSAEDQKQIKKDQWTEAITAEKPPADLTWKITKSEVNGDKAVVTVKISAEGESQDQPFALVKEDGVWKVSYLSSSDLNQK